jgi:hypothetical protein
MSGPLSCLSSKSLWKLDGNECGVMFKVPILNIEMKGEFDEGYKGLVNINLQDFVLNMKKENSYSTEIQVHLKTLIMEDLLEDENSEHRFLLISKQVEVKLSEDCKICS